MKNATWMTCLLAAGLTLAPLGCSKYGAWCEDQENCTGGNDMDIDACIEQTEEYEDEASAYDCGEEYDALWECAEGEAYCDNGHWRYTERCDSKLLSLNQCMYDATGIK